MTILTRAAATAISSLLVLSLAGCGGFDGTSKAAAPQPRESQAAEVIELPSGISFTAPDGWDELSDDVAEDAMGEVSEAGALDDLAQNVGISPAELADQVKAVDVFVAAPDGDDGFLSNINATRVPADLPRAGAIELEYRILGAKDITVEEAETAVGDGLIATFLLPMGSLEIRSAAVLVEHDGETTIITISTMSAEATEDLTEDLVESIVVTD